MSSHEDSFSSLSAEHNDALQSDKFSPADFIRQRLQGVKDGQETRQLKLLRAEMSAVNHASSEVLKNNVFKNYGQFIEAAKEISHLEREIYELSGMLTEQKILIESLMGLGGDDRASLHTVSSHTTTTSHHNPLQLLMQKMDGIAGILNNLRPTDRVVLHGEMTLLDGESKQPIQKQMLILLNDRLLVGNSSSSGGGKYSVESTFSLNNLAAVNVKDRESGGAGGADQMMKLLIFPEQRYYRCESARVKKQWLEEFETTKRNLLHEGSLVRQATIRGRRRSVQSKAIELATSGRPVPLATIADGGSEDGEDKENNEEEEKWLSEIPAELDDCIAHRDLDQAVELIIEWKACKTKNPTIDVQLQAREQHIVILLSDDMRRPGGAHGGPTAMKKARTLLTQLDRGTYAVDLYLRRRSTMQRTAFKDVPVSEEPISYVKHLISIFHISVNDVVTEFLSSPQHYCQILQWCSGELSGLLLLIRRHVIEVAPTMAVVSITWRNLMRMCDDLTNIGIQLTFEVHRLLCPAMENALETNFSNVMHGLRLRMSEEKWRPSILEGESALTRLIEEFADLGLSIEWSVSGRASLNISQHSLHFAKVAHGLARDLAPLTDSPCRNACDSYTARLWTEYLSHLADPDASSDAHAYSASFVVTQVLSICEHTYCGDTESFLSRLLNEEFPSLLKYANEKINEDGVDSNGEEVAHV